MRLTLIKTYKGKTIPAIETKTAFFAPLRIDEKSNSIPIWINLEIPKIKKRSNQHLKRALNQVKMRLEIMNF